MKNIDTKNLSQLTTLPDIWKVIERIALTLDLDDRTLSDMLLLTHQELVKYRETRANLPFIKLFNLSDRLNLGFDLIVTGKIDFQALAHHFRGDSNFLPEKYKVCALGKRRTSLVMLNFIENHLGWKTRHEILKCFQTNESIFANVDAPISFSFATDLSQHLLNFRMGKNIVARIGIHSFLKTSPEQVKFELHDCKHVGEIYERMCEEIVAKYFEKNFIYKMIAKNESSCSIIAIPNPELVEALKNQKPGNPATSLVRQGIASAYPGLLGLPMAIVREKESIYDGSSVIRYEINYDFAQTVLSQRLKTGLPTKSMTFH